jgi:fatty-acyl-CoA synthase
MTVPTRAHVLDTLIGDELPRFLNRDDIAAFEAQAPYAQRVAARNTYEALARGASIDPQAPALHFLPNADPAEPARCLSHALFLQKVRQAGHLFHSLGVGKGDVVSFLLPLVPQAFYTLLGAQTVGVANPVNPLLSPAQLAEILNAAGTKVLVCLGPVEGSDIWPKVQAIRDQLPFLQTVLVVGASAPGTVDLDTALTSQPGDTLPAPLPGPQDLAGYFHTGGTTGTPKLVRHTHENQVSQAWALRLMGLASPGNTVLFGLPLFHVGGALTQGLASLANGGALAVLTAAGWRDPRALRNLWRLVAHFKPRLFGGVPTVLAAALQVPRGDEDISSVQRASGGGSAIPVAVIDAYEKQFHWPVLEVYGMTETSSVHTMNYPDMPRQGGSVGLPLPYSKTRVVKLDAAGQYVGECEVDEIGVIAMAGPGVFSGYKSEKHNAGAFIEPGWVNSGDLGRLDAQGHLWITGRAKDLIIRGAHNIDPAPLEELLYRHPDVALAALVGQPDAYAGELPVAYVQLKPGVQGDAAGMLAYLREHTPERAAVPVALHFIAALPLTGVGKIFKPALREDAARRVALELVAPQVPEHAQLDVQVKAHATLGQVIAVQVRGLPAGEQATVADCIHTQLNPLTLRHEITFVA